MCCQKNKLELVDLNSTKDREFAGNSMQCKSTVIRCMRSDTHKHSIKIFRERVDSLNAAILVCRSSQKRDAVHHLRSATRRMEAQLTLLEISEVLTPHLDEIIQVRKRLIEIRRAAGKVRDLDVQFELMLTVALVVMVIFMFLRNLAATVIPAAAERNREPLAAQLFLSESCEYPPSST